jgi:hypothetical protein
MTPSKDEHRRLDPRMRRVLAGVAASGGVLTLGALAFAGVGVAFSVSVGAGLALGNLWALARIVVALLPDESAAAAGEKGSAGGGGAPPSKTGARTSSWAVLGVLKMVALMAVVWLLMRYGVVSPLPMVVGFGALPIGIAIGSLVSDRGGD